MKVILTRETATPSPFFRELQYVRAMEQKKPGPPRKYTDEEIAEALYRANGVITKAAELVGCDPSLIVKRKQSSPILKQVEANAKETLIAKAESQVEKALDDEEDKNRADTMAKFILSTLGSDFGWSQHKTIDHGVPDVKSENKQQEIKQEIKEAETEEELEEIWKKTRGEAEIVDVEFTSE